MCVHVYIPAVDNSVRVEHRDDFEDVALSEALCQRAGAHQELQRALHHPAGVSLSGVNACREKHQRTVLCTHTVPGSARTFLHITTFGNVVGSSQR